MRPAARRSCPKRSHRAASPVPSHARGPHRGPYARYAKVSLLGELGIEATGKRGFLLADGRRVEMDFGEARATINRDSVTTIVVFGEDEARPPLGVYTLEGLALAVDPEAQRPVPTHMILYWDSA